MPGHLASNMFFFFNKLFLIYKQDSILTHFIIFI